MTRTGIIGGSGLENPEILKNPEKYSASPRFPNYLPKVHSLGGGYQSGHSVQEARFGTR